MDEMVCVLGGGVCEAAGRVMEVKFGAFIIFF